MRIVLDVFGGDNAPLINIDGALKALAEKEGFDIVLVGKEGVIKDLLKDREYDKSRIEIVDAPTVITNDDAPTEAVRHQKDSSIVVSMNYLNNNDDAVAFVSAGSTGAVLTAAVLLLKRIKGVNRPALAPILPTAIGGHVCLIDCGANTEPKAQNLVQFAKMGAAYMSYMYGLANPKVALLSNGTEDKKGNTLTKEAFPLLKEAEDVNFVGNMEARELLSGTYDVVVSDGFTGNAALKSAEGTAITLFGLIKQNIMEGGIRAKIGYLLLKPALKKVKKVMDYSDQGGAVLLGLKKIVVKSHGSSTANTICASIIQAYELSASGIVSGIERSCGN